MGESEMNKVYGKKANSLVLNYDYSHLDIIPTPSKLSKDRIFARLIRRYNTYAIMTKKGVK
jgi:hypothetical protein